jgi:hypothetical protein
MNKEKLERENRLPRALLVSDDAYEVLVEMNEMGDDNTNNSNNNNQADGDSSQASFGSEGDRILAEEMADRDAMAAGDRGSQFSDEDSDDEDSDEEDSDQEDSSDEEDSIASGHASNWSMSTAEEVILTMMKRPAPTVTIPFPLKT